MRPYCSDLGDAKEKEGGYFAQPWNWPTIKQNAQWISLFAGKDDPYIPIDQARLIAEKLDCDYHEMSGVGHFGSLIEFPEIVTTIKRHTFKL